MAGFLGGAFCLGFEGGQALVGVFDGDGVVGGKAAAESTRSGGHVAFGAVHVEGQPHDSTFGAPLGEDSIQGVPLWLAVVGADSRESVGGADARFDGGDANVLEAEVEG